MKKKITSWLLTFSLCFSLISNLSILDVSAYSSSSSSYSVTIGNQTIPFADYPAGSYFTDNGRACTDHTSCGAGASLYNESACNCKCTYNGVALNSTSCYGFANMVFYRLFGHNTYSQTTRVVSNISASTINNTYLYNLFTNGTIKPGAHIRNSTHSMIYMGCDSSYIYTYEGNYDGECRVGVIQRTWSEMTTYLRGKSGINFIEMPNNYPGVVEDVDAPTITNLSISNANTSSFTINCSANEIIKRAYIIVYGPGGNSGNGFDVNDIYSSSFSKTINTNEYGGKGEYTVHVYLFDIAGNERGGSTGGFTIDSLMIKDFSVSNVNPNNFTLSCNASSVINRAYIIVYGPGGNSGNGFDIYDINSSSFTKTIKMQ